MTEAYARMLRNYADFRGRTSRFVFWSFVLVQSVITIVAAIILGLGDRTSGSTFVGAS